MGHSVAQLFEALRYMPEVAGSIPDGILGIFRLPNPSGRTTALRSTQPLTKMCNAPTQMCNAPPPTINIMGGVH